MVTIEHVLQCLVELITLRRNRSLAPSTKPSAALPAQQPNGGDSTEALAAPQLASPPPTADTSVHTAGASSRTSTRNTGSAGRSQSRSQAQTHGHQAPFTPGSNNAAIFARTDDQAVNHDHSPSQAQANNAVPVAVRESGASHVEQAQLQPAKAEAPQTQDEHEIQTKQLEREPAATDGTLASGTDGKAHSPSVRDILRDSQSALRKLTQNEDFQQRLRDMNRCPEGFSWIQESAGWRCEGGTHVI